MVESKPVVLVAEDDPDDRLLLEEALRPFRDLLHLSFTEDGEKLMECLKHESRFGDSSYPQPQLVLLNFKMPKKDGCEALSEIKQDPELRHIPIIMWTNSSVEEERRLCLEAGAEGCFTKPSNFADLESSMRAMVKRWIHSPVAEGSRSLDPHQGPDLAGKLGLES